MKNPAEMPVALVRTELMGYAVGPLAYLYSALRRRARMLLGRSARRAGAPTVAR